MAIRNDVQELQNALRIIKSECDFHKGSCSMCPLAIEDYRCGVTGESTCGNGDYKRKPQYWEIPEIKLLKKTEKKI